MFEISESGHQGIITVKGPITIASAVEFRDVFLKVQDHCSSLIVNLDGVTDIDVAGAQLLCSAHRTAVKLNKQLALTGRMTESANESMLKSGFMREKACVMGGENGCLWAGREQ